MAIEDLGNPFEEETGDLTVLDTTEIAGSEAVEAVRKMKRIGQEQFMSFTTERLVERTKPLDDIIRRNKLRVFVRSIPKNLLKEINNWFFVVAFFLFFNSPFGKRCFLRRTSGDAPLHQRMVAEVVPP